MTFPSGFVWGTATSAHQTEGGNSNTDWWEFEHAGRTRSGESSGDACDSWHRWPEDLDLVRDLGLGAYRFSVEWARIEPAPGEWSRAALDHYRRMAAGCRERGLVPFVTLHHFVLPLWLAREGGWENLAMPERFAAYCATTAEALAAEGVEMFATINEPNAYAAVGWIDGRFPPGKTDYGLCWSVMENQRASHRRAVEAIRAAAPSAKVGLTLSMADYQADPEGGEPAEHMAAAARQFMEDAYLDALVGDDYLGVQVYTRTVMGPSGPVEPAPDAQLTQMGTEVWPEALGAVLSRVADYTGGSLPMYVTENGLGTDDDDERIDYVTRALRGVHSAIANGADVRGYFYWSLLDNFEWDDGFAKTFGLVSVDRMTFARSLKPSAKWFGDVARAGGLP
jgi:beta-glucosidase